MELEDRARRIRLVCTDVDGVLTDGGLHFGPDGHTKVFCVKDGAGVKALQRAGIPVAFISGLRSASTEQRAADLGVVDCHTGVGDKREILASLCAKYGLEESQVAYLGDDLQDLPLLVRAGLACCPEDAALDVRSRVHWVVPARGGQGVLRAVAELILQSRGEWEAIVASYLG